MWQSAVADITAEVSDVPGLLKNLASVKCTVAQNLDIRNAELIEHIFEAAKTDAKYFCQWEPTESKPLRR